MHSAKALFAAFFFTLMVLLNASVIVRADDDDMDADEFDVTARVVRTSLLEGEVSLRRAGNKSWERATLNLPLVEGDVLATAKDARLEIQIDARNFVRVGADSMLRIVTLREGGIVLSLVEGTATLRLARFDRNQEYFELDAPKTTIAAEKPGLYRLDVAPGGGLHLTVREGGRARIYSDTSGFTLRDGRSAELVYDGSDEGDWQLSAAPSFDNWDRWVDDRERYLAGRLRYEQRDRYYDADIWGAEELDAYGDWVYASDYGGWVWRPHTTVINNYYNWAPYRHGHWRWCPPYGWTWVGDEPWGWAPYHYGRWVYYNDNWCWAPRGYGYRNPRNWWRPALVAFVYVPSSYGEHVAWYPLTYGQHDPYRSNHQRRADRLRPLRAGELNNLRRINPATVRAVTSVPAREFGNEGARVQPANTDIARRAVAGEPVRARLPIVPADSGQNSANERDRQPRGRTWPAARPAPTDRFQERPTGAAARQPGVPLDDELRRRRIYNGRDPRPAAPADAGADPADRSTGAVARPERPLSRRPIEEDTDRDRNFRNNLPSPARPARPARPRVREEEGPPSSPDESVAPQRRAERPTRAPRVEPPAPPEQAPPSESPDTIERPSARPERHAPVERDLPVERPARPQERQPTPPPQPEVRPEPQRPAPPAPHREEPPPPPPAEPAHREETPAPPPPSPPPPRDEPPPRQQEPERTREAPPQHDRLPERERASPPLD